MHYSLITQWSVAHCVQYGEGPVCILGYSVVLQLKPSCCGLCQLQCDWGKKIGFCMLYTPYTYIQIHDHGLGVCVCTVRILELPSDSPMWPHSWYWAIHTKEYSVFVRSWRKPSCSKRPAISCWMILLRIAHNQFAYICIQEYLL